MAMASAPRDPVDRPLMRVCWFFDAGYHVEVDNAEMYNLETWTSGCIAERPGGDYVVALGDENNGFDAQGRAEAWYGALQWLEEQARGCYPQKPVYHQHDCMRS
jgi:hypothetical protein